MSDRPQTRAEKDAAALSLHLAGVPYSGIAKALDLKSKSTAHAAVQRALEQQNDTGTSAQERQTQLARLDTMLAGLWPKARRGDVAAVDRVLKIEERRAMLVAQGRERDRPAQPAPVKGVSPVASIAAKRAARLAASDDAPSA